MGFKIQKNMTEQELLASDVGKAITQQHDLGHTELTEPPTPYDSPPWFLLVFEDDIVYLNVKKAPDTEVIVAAFRADNGAYLYAGHRENE